MKIVHISTSDIQGGAAKAAFRLHQGLSAIGKDSSMYVAQKFSNDPSIACYAPVNRLPHRIRRALRKESLRRTLLPYAATRPGGYEHFRHDQTEFGGEVWDQLPPADVINLHWIADFVDYRTFLPQATLAHPTLWTLHDMNPFTGGCHFDHACGRFADSCGSCPQLGSSSDDDLSYRIWNRKRTLFHRIDSDQLSLVTPSLWMAREVARSSILGKFSTNVIPYGVDTEIFRPRPSQISARRGLEISDDAFVILFLAEYSENRRKGFTLLDRALGELTEVENVLLLSIGKGFPATTARIPHRHLGTIENDHLLATIFSLADVFVIPSIQDNLPNTVLEAMACGTPVVGFDAGGIRDMIRDGETGCLVAIEDVHALAAALQALQRDPGWRASMGHQCRQTVMEHYPIDLQARRYLRLYRDLIAARRPPLLP